jgi:hypothetical protein
MGISRKEGIDIFYPCDHLGGGKSDTPLGKSGGGDAKTKNLAL